MGEWWNVPPWPKTPRFVTPISNTRLLASAGRQHKNNPAPLRLVVARAQAMGRWFALDWSIGPVVGADDIRLDILRMPPNERRYVLRGASRRQLQRLINWSRRWWEAVEQIHSKERAEAFRREVYDESHDTLLRVVRDAWPRRESETPAGYAVRLDHYVQSIRGRLTPPRRI